MIDRVSSFVVHSALGILAVIFLPIAVLCLPFWLIGAVVGRLLEMSEKAHHDDR